MMTKVAIGLAAAVLFTWASPASATSYRWYAPRQIVEQADLLVEGTITSIVGPPSIKGDKKRGASVAVVRIDRVFKCGAKVQGETRFIYWSRQGQPKDEWFAPDTYKVGEKLMMPLQKRKAENWKEFTAPKEAEQTPWSNWSPRAIYGKQIQSPEFRAVAEIWVDPTKALGNPKLRGDAAFFLALQKRMPEKLLLQLLESADITDQHAGCLAAGVLKLNVALAPLVNILERQGSIIANWNDLSAEEQERMRPSRNLYDAAGAALSATPFDGVKDGPPLLRLARCGEVGGDYLERILRACPARWQIARALQGDAKAKPDVRTIYVLHALDPRAAYEPLRKLVADDKKYEFATLINQYETAWAQRFVLEHATRLARGFGVNRQFDIVRGSFGFTHQSVDPYVRRKGAGVNETWDKLYAELRQYAKEQLALTEKKGPSFGELPKRLEHAVHWEVRPVGAKTFRVLTNEQRRDLGGLIVGNAKVQATGLSAGAEAAWLVDLYDDSFDRSLPIGQLWVARDGTFGFGWLPDRAWGKSAKIAKFLQALE